MYICSENVYHVFCVGTLGGGHVSSDSVRSESGEVVKEDLDMEGEERRKAAEAEEERRLEAEIHVSHYSINTSVAQTSSETTYTNTEESGLK